MAVRSPFHRVSSLSEIERVSHGVQGHVPALQHEAATKHVKLVLDTLTRLQFSPLSQYEFLISLLDRDVHLFYTAALAHTSTIMPLIYTPVVGLACQNWSRILVPARGLYISLRDAGRVEAILRSWKLPVRAICVTDGERILGLGDLGTNGMGIPLGKLALYTALAGVDPSTTLPVQLDMGTNNAENLADEHYVGLRQPRGDEASYYALVDEFVQGVKNVFGPQTLLQWEDFGNSTAFVLLEKYKSALPSFNDDIEGTASVVLGGLLSACANVDGVPALAHGTYLFYGAGEAGVGIAELLAYTISLQSGVSIPEARQKIFLIDSKGLITSERAASEKLAHHKLPYAHTSGVALLAQAGDATKALAALEDIVRLVKPTALIGVSAIPQTFTESVIKALAEINARPVVFALSNPTSKAECTAEQAYTWSNGAAVFASGSPFDPVTLADGRVLVPGQGNNAYIFPAVGLAVVACQLTLVPQHTFYVAAAELAACVSKDDVARNGCIYPDLATIRNVSLRIAVKVAEDAYERGFAALSPKPTDLVDFLKKAMWVPSL